MLQVAFTPDGNGLVTCGRDRITRLWDLTTGTEMRTFAGHTDNVEAIAVTCGFGSLRRMDRAFARSMSASPTEFRSRFKTNGAKHVAF